MPNSSTASLKAPPRPDFGADALVYIEKVRQATKRLHAQETNPEDIRGALQSVRNLATFNVDVPVLSARREVQVVKKGVKRLSAWYMRYLSAQLNAFGATVVRLGETMAARVEDLERRGDDLSARLGAVEARLNRLETKTSATTPLKRSARKDAPDED
jgi:hypothetical protein